jgi:hypothetical protein
MTYQVSDTELNIKPVRDTPRPIVLLVRYGDHRDGMSAPSLRRGFICTGDRWLQAETPYRQRRENTIVQRQCVGIAWWSTAWPTRD